MSKFVKVRTELRDPLRIALALDDLQLEYTRDTLYVHPYSRTTHPVDLLIGRGLGQFGLRPNEHGDYEAVGDDMQSKQTEATLKRIRQRYAYHSVRAELETAGFELVEESTGRDAIIRMTVRRWS